MTNNITELDNNTTRIEVDFADEGVDLQGNTTVKGTEQDALKYLPVFERDLRTNYADRFPRPESEPMPEEEMMI